MAIKTEPAKRTEAQKRQAIQAIGTVGVTETDVMAALSPEDRKKAEALKQQIADLEKSKPPALPSAMAITDPTPNPGQQLFPASGQHVEQGIAHGARSAARAERFGPGDRLSLNQRHKPRPPVAGLPWHSGWRAKRIL